MVPVLFALLLVHQMSRQLVFYFLLAWRYRFVAGTIFWHRRAAKASIPKFEMLELEEASPFHSAG